MSESTTVEQRLAQVEKELADLKNDVKALKPAGNWIEAISGTFKDDPEFDEILRLGKQIRDADKPAEELSPMYMNARDTISLLACIALMRAGWSAEPGPVLRALRERWPGGSVGIASSRRRVGTIQWEDASTIF